jgi:hypothetical protein
MNERDRAGTSASAVSIAFRSPLQGDARSNPSLGLKPWAMIYNRFAVNPLVAGRGAPRPRHSQGSAMLQRATLRERRTAHMTEGSLTCGSLALPTPLHYSNTPPLH